MTDPPTEGRELLARADADIKAGRVLPGGIALLPLQWWVFQVLFRIAPLTWGHKYRHSGEQKVKKRHRA